MNLDNLTLEHGLVIKSDTLDSEGTYSNSRKPSSTFSRMKWYFNVDMFRTVMDYIIFTESNCTLVIHIYLD